MQELITRKTSLSANLVGLCRYLRTHGYTIGPTEEADLLKTLQITAPFETPETLRMVIKAVLARTRSQQLDFDELYKTYWKEVEKAVNSKVAQGQGSATKNEGKPNPNKPTIESIKSWIQGNTSSETKETAAYSANVSTGHKDFSAFSEAELQEVFRLIHLIARTLALQESRRLKKDKRGGLDLRRTLRLNLRRGGEILDLAFRKTQKQKQQIVLLCDVSKSMDLYSRFLVQFLYAFQNAYKKIETFVFSTSLHRVTSQVQQKEWKEAMEELALTVPGWSGGTRIGSSLYRFCELYANKLLNKRTVVLIMSDGWDTGDIELLEKSMQIIHKKAAKVIWLNPLAGNPNFKPTVKGMQTAMPYIDIFASAHNVDSLRSIARFLKKKRFKRSNFNTPST